MTILPPPNEPNLEALPEPFRHAKYVIAQRLLRVNSSDAEISTPDGACKLFSRAVSFSIDNYAISTKKHGQLLRARLVPKFLLKEVYAIEDADKTLIGTLQRPTRRYDQRTLWEVLNADNTLVALLQEKDAGLAIARRIVGNWVPQTYLFNTEDGQELARCERSFLAYHLTLNHDWRSIVLDPRLALVATLFITR